MVFLAYYINTYKTIPTKYIHILVFIYYTYILCRFSYYNPLLCLFSIYIYNICIYICSDELVASSVRFLKSFDKAILVDVMHNQPIALAVALSSGLLLIIFLIKLCCCSSTKKNTADPAKNKQKKEK